MGNQQDGLETKDRFFNRVLKRYVNIYRVITAIGLIVAVCLSLAIPAHLMEPDDWSYYYAIHNFADGKLVVNDEVHNAQSSETQTQVGHFIDYVNVGANKWALEKAPGYVFYDVPFELMGIPRWGNALLALGVAFVMFLLLRRLRDEKTACIGTLLMLFTPVSLVMLNRSYMDTFAAGAFLVMGGGLYIYWAMERARLNRIAGAGLLFTAFLLISWSVVTRYTNVAIAVFFALHFAFLVMSTVIKRVKTNLKVEIPVALFGIGIPLAVLLFYDKAVFGSPFDYGYKYTSGDITFAFQHIGELTRSGQSVFWNIIKTNLQIAPRDLIVGFPLLIIVLIGLCFGLYQLLSARRYKNEINTTPSQGKKTGLDIILLLLGWFVGGFLLYLLYEWTANTGMGSRPFIVYARFYFPGLFPLAVFSALFLSKLRAKIGLGITAALIIVGAILYLQSINVQLGNPGRILPNGVQPNRPSNGINTLPGGGIRPPLLPPGVGNDNPPNQPPANTTTPATPPP